jgi:hypothetical protein
MSASGKIEINGKEIRRFVKNFDTDIKILVGKSSIQFYDIKIGKSLKVKQYKTETLADAIEIC